MSDTPETDAAQHEGLLRTNPIPMQVVTANFARRLERERDEAREVAEQLYDAAAYGLAQWESATPATLAEKIVPALQAFQKLKVL
jgi:hypothetical protein